MIPEAALVLQLIPDRGQIGPKTPHLQVALDKTSAKGVNVKCAGFD